MSALNQIILEGNAVKDAEVRTKPWGTKFGTLSLANNRYYKDKQGNFADEVSYFDVVVFGEGVLANLVKNAKKGSAIRVIGRIKQERWESKDGKRVSRNVIIAQHIDFLKKPKPAENPESEKKDDKKILANLVESYSGIMKELDDTEASITVDEEEATF
jgi:single-strand DNA-binding protein